MKHILLTVAILTFFFAATGQSINGPQGITYDSKANHYLLTNYNGANILTVKPGSAPSVFASSVPNVKGIAIVGDTIYACYNGNQIKRYNRTTGASLASLSSPFGGIFTNICSDNNGRLYITDFGSSSIYRHIIGTSTLTQFKVLSQKPTGIVFDSINNRLVVATYNSGGLILGISLVSSTVSILQSTNLTQMNGLTQDQDGSFFLSSTTGGINEIYLVDSAFVNPPVRVDSLASNHIPYYLFYNRHTDTLAVPISGANTVRYYGFPRPRPANDYVGIAVNDTTTICALQNDFIDQNKPLYLKSVSAPQLGRADTIGNCIRYIGDSAGVDTLTYEVCTIDTPEYCSSAVVYVFIGNYGPFVSNDYDTTIQAATDTINVLQNDFDVNGDSLCLSYLMGSPHFTIAPNSCSNIVFNADSFFIGNDTCLYVVCDNDTVPLCDTGMLVVNVKHNQAFAPTASFVVDFQNFRCYNFTTINTSVGDTGIARWVFTPQWYPSMTLYGDTGYYLNMNMWGFYGEVCLYVSNQFGSDSVCHDYSYICEGLADQSTQMVAQIFPNPVTNKLTIVSTYAGNYRLYNQLGQLCIQLVGSGSIEIDVSDLPAGTYTIALEHSASKALEFKRFVIQK